MTTSNDGCQVTGIKVEDVSCSEYEECPELMLSSCTKDEHENYMDSVKNECGSCTELCVQSCGEGYLVDSVKVEECAHVKQEEDLESLSIPEIKTEDEKYMDSVRDEPSSGTEICVQSCVEGSLVASVDIEQVAHWKEEEDPKAISCPKLQTEHENEEDDMETVQESQASRFQESQFSMLQQFAASISQNHHASAVPTSDQQRLTPTTARPAKAPRSRLNDITRVVGELKQLQQSINNEAPYQFDVFGSCIAVQLKNLPYDKALIAQSKIQALLTDVAFVNFRCNSVSSNESEILSSSITPHYDSDFNSDVTVYTESYTREPDDLLAHAIAKTITNDIENI